MKRKNHLLSFIFCIIICLFFSFSNSYNTTTKLQTKAAEALKYCKTNSLNTSYCILIDMSIPSGKNRFFVWDFTKNAIVYSSLCSHGIGKGSTIEKPVFSNEPGSYCTSLGKYKIGIRSYSQYGIHVHYKLHGLEQSNSNAFKRIVVLHSYAYVPEQEIHPEYIPLGYSLGCPVISNSVMTKVDMMLQNQKTPMLLWIFN